MRPHFDHLALYLASIPTYPGGLWSFTLGARGMDPAQVDPAALEARFQALGRPTHYYTPAVHRAAFILPPFVQRLLSA